MARNEPPSLLAERQYDACRRFLGKCRDAEEIQNRSFPPLPRDCRPGSLTPRWRFARPPMANLNEGCLPPPLPQ